MNNNAKTILETIVSMGYSKRGSIAYKCIDDIVAYFSVDCPSGLIYITFGIVPLFVPSEKYFTYSYASRMNEISPDLKIITKEDDYKVVLNWTLKFRSVIEATIESYISRISKANIMIDYFVNENSFANNKRLLNYNRSDLIKLIVYGYCYIGRREKAMLYISELITNLETNNCSSRSTERIKHQAEELYLYLQNSSDSFINNEILSNIQANKDIFKLR